MVIRRSLRLCIGLRLGFRFGFGLGLGFRGAGVCLWGRAAGEQQGEQGRKK